MTFFESWPYPLAVGTLFVIVFLRANATYWLGRAAQAGARRTRMARLLRTSGYRRAEQMVARWGTPVVTASFLTVGLQTMINAAAGVTRMPLRRYVPAMALGGVFWAFLYATVGFITIEAWTIFYRAQPVVAVALAALAVAALVFFVVRALRRSVIVADADPQDAPTDDPAQPVAVGRGAGGGAAGRPDNTSANSSAGSGNEIGRSSSC